MFQQNNQLNLQQSYQLKLNLNLDFLIPNDSDVRLIHALFSNIHINFPTNPTGRPYAVPQGILLEILIYGYMNRLFSSRSIASACTRDVNFMWLLQGYKAPSHSTIARFRNSFQNINEVLAQIVSLLFSNNEITFDEVFIDGTKLEANANKYTFVWKKAVSKHHDRLLLNIENLLESALTELYINANNLHELLNKLAQKNIIFVHGIGKRKSLEQKYYEKATEYSERLAKYEKYNELFDGRNSFSKTDTDATFMRMKEDAMKNGQLKPGYNLQIAVNSEYITSVFCSSDRDDVNTLIPFLEKMKYEHGEKYNNIVADSGYESEENYLYLEKNNQVSYIKPTNYEISKTAKYKRNKSRRENMEYDEIGDFYTCQNQKKLLFSNTAIRKTKKGYETEVAIYECESCEGCPHKEICTKAKGNRKLQYSKVFEKKRLESLANIITTKGVNLRTNRSIQVEGAFGVLKQDLGFRRFLMRGMKNVKTEFTLLCIAYNTKKLYNKTMNFRNCTHLHILNE